MTAVVSTVMAFGLLLSTASTANANAMAGGGYSSSYAGESVFEGKAAGESGQFSAIFFNDGTQSWAPGVVGLLICLPDKVTCNVASPNASYASGWYSNTVYATVSSTVAPGQNGFFVYNFAVPAGTAGGTVATFNGDVGLIATGTELRPEGYYQQNTTPAVLGTLTISPTSASMAVAGQQQFTATTNLTGTVSWSVTGGCGAVTGSGLFVATATNNTTTQPCSVVASTGSLTASAAITVFGPATQLACSASPASIVAGGGTNGTTTLTIKVEDLNGNVVTTSTPAITVTNATPSLATLSSSGSLAATNGVLTVTVTSTSTTGQIIISASSTSSITGCTATITSGSAGAPTQTAVSFSINPIAADGTSTSTLRADIEDANGNRVTTDSSTIIDISLTSGAGVCTVVGVVTGTSGTYGGGAGTATDVNGRVEFSVQSTTTPGTCTFVATPRNTSISSGSGTLTTQIVGSATNLKVTANDSPHAAGSSSKTTVTVAIFDAVGHQVTGANSTSITATLDTSGSCTGAGGGSVGISSSNPITSSGGQAVFTFTSDGAYTGCAVTFTASGLSSASTTMVFTAGSADHLGCTFSPNPIIDDGSSTSAALVYVKDQVGNNLLSGSYSVNLTYQSGSGVTTLLTSNPQTMSSGVATFQVRSTTAVGTDTYKPSLASGSLPDAVADQSCQISTVTSIP
ncbi:MAG: hypothetical protein KGJ98_07475 [Chloroflexota bacterium]|nr:hypothetical protein [Chloroflexota bacterium]